MVNKIISIFLISAVIAGGTWSLIFTEYYETNEDLGNTLSLGSWPAALEALQNYQKNPLSYPFYHAAKLKKYRYRLDYLEGVIYSDAGNTEAAVSSFRKAAESSETAIAAAAKYNLAYFAIRDNSLDKARSLLNEALLLEPNDSGAKINLELTLKQIQARQQTDLPEKQKKPETMRPEPMPGEQWRLDVPDEEGEGSGAASGQRYL